jgi:hypothetical protein
VRPLDEISPKQMLGEGGVTSTVYVPRSASDGYQKFYPGACDSQHVELARDCK